MELKDTLAKPCTASARIDFIVKNNHQKGYEIKETPVAFEAWGPTAEEQSEIEKQKARQQKIEQLADIDNKSIRSLRAKLAGTATEADTAKLAELEAQAAEIRGHLDD